MPTISDETRPFRRAPDEMVLWTQAEKEERTISRSGKILDDPSLAQYLGSVAARVVPAGLPASGALDVRVLVLRDPTLNAFAMPDGTVYVHTGLLARLENEAQLAVILAHELTHVTNRHALRLAREGRAPWTAAARPRDTPSPGLAVVAGSPLPGPPRGISGPLAGPGLELALAAAVSGYGRKLEREADTEAIARMIEARYDPWEAPRAFTLLLVDHGDPGRREPFLLGSHAELRERRHLSEALLATRYSGVARIRLLRAPEPFLQRTRDAVRENAALDIRAGNFRWGEEQLGRVLSLATKDPVALVYYGDLYRLEAQRAGQARERPALLARGREKYEEAASLDPAYPVPWRQLGLLYFQERETDKASAAFRKYLKLEPDAPDARRIQEYVRELDR